MTKEESEITENVNREKALPSSLLRRIIFRKTDSIRTGKTHTTEVHYSRFKNLNINGTVFVVNKPILVKQ